MGFEDLEPVFGEARVEWVSKQSGPSDRFLFHVHAPDPSRLTIHITDFHSNSTWEAVRSVMQLEDMRDDLGIGGSWSEFMDYVLASFKSRDVKLILDGHSESDNGPAYAKLVAQKTKGMPVISIPLTKLTGSAASAAIANLSLQLFKAFKSTHELYVEGEQDRSIRLTKMISAERERSESIQSQLEQYSKRQKLQKTNSSDNAGVSSLLNNALQSPEKQAARDTGSTKVASRVVPAHRRARVRGVLLQDTEDNEDEKKQ
ncbi:U2 small nuclear ribonucleoprotein auxiliary factor-like protein [Parasponia andersonii]|uniref:U2 small nuclear ribonucleoprotein auxiliary factor-like protein n=1 Tax=Parasponia andersonii TaxID=3476 RepID=A0A2P5AB52_PARAD|nr:U2 small nuclear ribonucleoprotein auxiliary factor-like protein [Parasponia andersonii]